MKEFRFDDLVRAIISAGIEFCSFPKNDFAGVEVVETSIVERVLADIEAGGWMGQKENEERD